MSARQSAAETMTAIAASPKTPSTAGKPRRSRIAVPAAQAEDEATVLLRKINARAGDITARINTLMSKLGIE